MKFKAFLFAVAAGVATLVSCSEKPEEGPKEEEFVFEALTLEGVNFQIMDRNVGAASTKEIGNFYQWGNNTPVAANADLKVNESYDADWTLAKAADWTKPENTPCPKGWRLPTADDMKALTNILDNIAMYDFGYATDEELDEAEALLDSMGLIATGKFVKGQEGKYLEKAQYFWTAAVVDMDNGFVGLFENNNFPTLSKKTTLDTAAPVRCVK